MNEMNNEKKLFLAGIDGMSPKILERFISEGGMPNIAKLISNGVYSKAVSSLPVFTPTNWATISTGATSGTHSVFLWGSHSAGESLEEDHFDECMTSTVCKAEYLWETALRYGRKSVLLNYIGYPSDQEGIYHVDWFYGPNRDYFGLATSCVYNIPVKDKSKDSKWVKWTEPWDRDGSVTIDVPFKNNHGKHTFRLRKSAGESVGSHELATLEYEGGKVELREGEWTDWIRIKCGNGIATVRWKILPMYASDDDVSMRIYRSSMYLDTDFCSPTEVGRELFSGIGPYINDDAGKLYVAGLVDRETFLDEARYKIRWIAQCFKFMSDHHDTSLFFLHWHYVDTLQHSYLGYADSTGGDYEGEESEKHAIEMLREGYALADELVGNLMDIAGEEDVFVVVSDHGNIPNHHRVSLYNLFMEKGWTKIHVVDGIPKVNIPSSRVFVNLSHVYLNVRGRDPEGIVKTEEYNTFREEVRSAILSIRDPDSGLSPFAAVMRKEEADAVGLWGGGIGDLVLVFERGYVWSGSEVASLGEKRIVWKTGGANHGPQPPTAETKFSSNFATFMASAPGLKKGYVRKHAISLTDVVPIACRILNMETTAQCEGTVPKDMFEGGALRFNHNTAKAKYPVRTRVIVAPKSFKGDVTDED